MFAIYVPPAGPDRTLPAEPLQSARPLGIVGRGAEDLLREAGFLTRQWGPEDRPDRDVIGGQVDRLRKKMCAHRRRSGGGKVAVFHVPLCLGQPSSERSQVSGSSKSATRQAGEVEYFRTVMLPFRKKRVRELNFHSQVGPIDRA